MTVIYTVDVAKFTAPITGEIVGTVDVCRDDKNVHIRFNKDHNDIVMVLSKEQARRLRQIIDKAIDGIVPMFRSQGCGY